MSVSPEERERFKNQRIAKGWDQYDLADRAGVTQGAVSNFESGRTKQPFKIVYARLYRALFGPNKEPTSPDEPDNFVAIVEGVTELDAADRAYIATMIKRLRKPAPTRE